MSFNELKAANPHLEILTTSSPEFAKFGMIVEKAPVAALFDQLDSGTEIPADGVVYVASDDRFEKGTEFKFLQDGFYGGMPMQIGYCNGKNDSLNALEYHRGCEVTIAVTEIVLLLADFSDIKDGKIDSGVVKAFYVAAGEAFALFESALHFAPCSVKESGFKTGIVLPRDTNTEYHLAGEPKFWQDKLIFARNKWLIAHPDSAQAKEGAYVGITGENIKVNAVK